MRCQYKAAFLSNQIGFRDKNMKIIVKKNL